MAKYSMDDKKSKQKYFFKKKKKNLVLTFDENARKEFLTGFHKRKVQRKKKAQEELDKQLKVERKRIKAEAKQAYKKLVLSQRTIPELEELLSQEIDMGTHSVSVTELSSAELARENNWIGANQVQYEDNRSDEGGNEDDKDGKEGLQDKKEVEGMEIKRKTEAKEKNKAKFKTKQSQNELKTKKDVRKAVKNQATQQVKKSKIFQAKSKFEKVKNLKMKKKQEKLDKRKPKDKRTKHKSRK